MCVSALGVVLAAILADGCFTSDVAVFSQSVMAGP